MVCFFCTSSQCFQCFMSSTLNCLVAEMCYIIVFLSGIEINLTILTHCYLTDYSRRHRERERKKKEKYKAHVWVSEHMLWTDGVKLKLNNLK